MRVAKNKRNPNRAENHQILIPASPINLSPKIRKNRKPRNPSLLPRLQAHLLAPLQMQPKRKIRNQPKEKSHNPPKKAQKRRRAKVPGATPIPLVHLHRALTASVRPRHLALLAPPRRKSGGIGSKSTCWE